MHLFDMALIMSDISIFEEPTHMLMKMSTNNSVNRKLITKKL